MCAAKKCTATVHPSHLLGDWCVVEYEEKKGKTTEFVVNCYCRHHGNRSVSDEGKTFRFIFNTNDFNNPVTLSL
jgi:hypothetical protein